jgi:hypothetical protein
MFAGRMHRKGTLGADSSHRGLVYPHKVGLTSHIRNGNFVEVWSQKPLFTKPTTRAVSDNGRILC